MYNVFRVNEFVGESSSEFENAVKGVSAEHEKNS